MPRSPYALLLLLTTWCFWGGPEPEEVRDDDVPDDVLDPLLPPRPPSAPTSPTESVEPGEAPPSVGGIALPNDLTHLHRESLRRLAYPGWVVQADDPRALYDRSAGVTLSGPAQEAMLVCRAVLHGGGYDDSLFAGGADVYLRLRVGGGALRHTLQTPIRTYTFPLSELAPGDSVAVTVMDDDVFADDRIGSGSGTFGGGELVIDAGGASVTCRPVAPEVVQEGRERARRRLRAAVARLGTPRPRLDQPDFAYPMSAAGEVRAAIPPAHAWSVHSDPEVSAMVEQAAAFEEAWQDAIGTAIDDAVERLPGRVGGAARAQRHRLDHRARLR